MKRIRKHAKAPKPSAERRMRRAWVESMMVDGTPHMQIIELAALQFSVHPRTVSSDIKLFKTRWAKDDAEDAAVKRARVLRGLERNARLCLAEGDRTGNRQALIAIGRLMGMGAIQFNINQDNRHQEVHVHQVKMPESPEEQQAWLDDYVRASCEMDGKPVPKLPAKAAVVDVKTRRKPKRKRKAAVRKVKK